MAKFSIKDCGHPFFDGELPSNSKSKYGQVEDDPHVATPFALDDGFADTDEITVRAAAVASSPFWVSISSHRGYRRVHRTGACWHRAAEVVYANPLEEAGADAMCKECFKTRPAEKDVAQTVT